MLFVCVIGLIVSLRHEDSEKSVSDTMNNNTIEENATMESETPYIEIDEESDDTLYYPGEGFEEIGDEPTENDIIEYFEENMWGFWLYNWT